MATQYRFARAVLVSLVALAVLVQIPSIFLARYAAHELWAGQDTASIWQEYRSRPAPEILLLGASSTRSDVDVNSLSESTSRLVGRRVTIGKFGLNGEGPDFYVAALERILSRPSRPRLIFLQVDSLLFTAKDVLDPTRDLWLLSDPMDGEYMKTALRVAPSPGHLVLDWGVPFFATYPLISVWARCPFTVGARELTRRAHLPATNMARQKTPCEEGAHPSADARMSPEDEEKTRRDWAMYLHDYEFSERKAALLREAARMVRAAGATPFLITYPSYRLRSVNPSVEERFHSRIVKEASRVQAPLIDLAGYVIDEPTLWADAAHLNQWGAKEFSHVLAASIAAAALQ
jgi:hypothetical protein